MTPKRRLLLIVINLIVIHVFVCLSLIRGVELCELAAKDHNIREVILSFFIVICCMGLAICSSIRLVQIIRMRKGDTQKLSSYAVKYISEKDRITLFYFEVTAIPIVVIGKIVTFRAGLGRVNYEIVAVNHEIHMEDDSFTLLVYVTKLPQGENNITV